jgi:lipid-binding SYLF domain-containing protein
MLTTLIGIVLLPEVGWGCATAPDTRPEEASLEARADAAVLRMIEIDPALGPLLAEAPGYVVFPSITEGAVVVGGGGGVGVLFENGEVVGYAELTQGSIGAQIGGQTYTELIVFRTADALARFKTDNFDLEANAGATALASGAVASAPAEGGTAVFVADEAGLMVEASFAGQQIDYQPR